MRHIVAFIVNEELFLDLVCEFLKATGMLSFKDIHIDNFFLLAFLSLLSGFDSSFVDFLWCNIVKGLFDDLVHVEHTDVIFTPVLLHEHVRNGLLAREGTAEDGQFDGQVRWDHAGESLIVSFVSRLFNLCIRCTLVDDAHLRSHAAHQCVSLRLVESLEHHAQLFVLYNFTFTWLQELLDLELFSPVRDQVTLELVEIERARV